MKIEQLALAIAKSCGAFNPESEAFKLNNPGLLTVYSVKHASEMENGKRRFASFSAGFRALVFDLQLKCSGKSRSKLKVDSPLTSLLGMWEVVDSRKFVLFLRRACNDETITEQTKLEYFL